jgi:hypothetical protein
MRKQVRLATAPLFALALSGGPAAATDDAHDLAAALVRPPVVERERAVRETGTESPTVGTVAPSTCSQVLWTAEQPLNSAALTYAVVSETDGPYSGTAAEARLSAGVITPIGLGDIGSLKWWGISEEADPNGSPEFLQQYCAIDDNQNRQFRIVFYSNDNGRPGQPLAIRNVVPSDVLTDVDWDPRSGAEFVHLVAEYTATFADPIDATEVAWFSVRRSPGPSINDGNQCLFAWVNESSAAYDEVWAFDTTRMDTGDDAFDLTYCLQSAVPSGDPYVDIYHADFERGDLRYWIVGP